MIRVLYYLLIFLSPLAVYILWIVLSKGRIVHLKFFWPLIIGLFLMISSLFSSVFFSDTLMNKKYNHPRVIDGEFKEGHFTE